MPPGGLVLDAAVLTPASPPLARRRMLTASLAPSSLPGLPSESLPLLGVDDLNTSEEASGVPGVSLEFVRDSFEIARWRELKGFARAGGVLVVELVVRLAAAATAGLTLGPFCGDGELAEAVDDPGVVGLALALEARRCSAAKPRLLLFEGLDRTVPSDGPLPGRAFDGGASSRGDAFRFSRLGSGWSSEVLR